MRLEGKVAIITGGGAGMGRATALEFLRQGAKVAILDIDEKALASTVEEGKKISDDIIGFRADVTQEEVCKDAVEQVMAKFGKIDVLFNNLGINLSATITETSEAQWEKIFAVNVRSMFLMSKYVLPIMMEQKDGVLINTSSSGGEVALKGLAAYSASKGAVISLTRSIAIDYAPYNIRANYLIPGVIMTEMTKQIIAAQPNPQEYSDNMCHNNLLQRFGEEHEIAMAAVYLASGETAFMTGASLIVDGGYLAQ